ncbi:hypothetical protein CANTEDRAFT_108380 [Yamadazyma tenuis ATCC 10573]|uniref:SSD domain-containing protein n=1 Tax=Candida tenuis (strain ATCC 10573 / BCRC 21748 / CBS 615 / JCM 9827 / NBRC 10315 / NRRL Y-1498 / VKM Y-70) TaxID=590646 RepID=G3B7N2_CANTC|nr:uncharacterized protein CANTEDRAFT_108380 [Yamadazyma tenuis ATCC 10573]EGV61654.1 hypothetical protein CANTEDRAFT_108380 [Yamadazyma tenuis ATCC 10573]
MSVITRVIAHEVHQPGYCAMYGNCGKKSFFGAQLPCPSSTKAVEPDTDSKNLLRDICGADFPVDHVCCSPEQITALQANLKKVDPLISSCPACRKNFYDFFCEFTCSANQSMFVNISKTAVASDTKKEIVTELTQYVAPGSAERFFDSCKNLKFSATNGYAMDLIGGGATNYTQFLKFLGDEKPLLGGSPFQINFAYGVEKNSPMTLRAPSMRDCNDSTYKCACSDCEEACPVLEPFEGLDGHRSVAGLPYLTFASIMGMVAFVVGMGIFHMRIARARRAREAAGFVELVEQTSVEAVLVSQKSGVVEYFKRLDSRFIESIETGFTNLGYFSAKFPGFTILCSLFLIALLSMGMIWLEFETDPVNLWVSPNEPQLKNYQYFEETFGEWYRIEQIIVSRKDDGPILDWKTVQWWFDNELALQEFEDGNETLSLEDFCFKPLGDYCAIESFTQYFGGNILNLDEKNWQKSLQDCTNSPVNCLPTFQQPLKKNLLFNQDDVLDSKAFTVTLLLNKNSKDLEYTQKVEKYENYLKDWLLKLSHENPHFNIAFSTEVSLTQELNQSTNTDIKIVVISYLLMFLYASVSLGGQIPTKLKLKSLLYTRFELGLAGIIIILLSVTSSLGFFSLIGLKSTLIIAEVIPFLVLAIGIDNIFLIVHELKAVNEDFETVDAELEVRVSKALGRIGPSCFISAILQVSMFLLATNVDMPAVKNFAFYSAGAIIVNVFLQMTCFVSLLTLDQKRLEDGRLDCMPWIKVTIAIEEDEYSGNFEYNFSKVLRKYYAPKILSKTAKPKILTVFIFWFGISLSLLPYIELGLDQKIALPSESYLVNYFDSVAKYLNVGPPIFMVMKNFDLSKRENQQKVCGKFSTCEEFSLSNVLEQEYQRGNLSTVVDPLSNWLDDFLTWLNPNLDQCCRLKKNTQEFCSPTAPERLCEVCYLNHDPPYNINMDGLPEGDEFMFFFNEWIQSPSDPCPLGGKAPYGTAVSSNETSIVSSYFRTSHGPLRTQSDFITAYRNSLRIVDEVKSYQGEEAEMFAFSPFYIFFVQYENIIKLTFSLLAVALLLIWVLGTVVLGSVRSASVLAATVVSVLVNIGGILAVWGVSLNAVSLVNLVICVGLAVEFCIHIVRGFTKAEDTIDENDESLNDADGDFIGTESIFKDARTIKTYHTLVNIGGSVLGGITITKLIGICVLAFTRSKIFEVYYFRMWLSLVFVAGVHALCLLPILLSYFG